MSANDLFHIKSKSVTTTLSVESLRFSQIYFLAICLFYISKVTIDTIPLTIRVTTSKGVKTFTVDAKKSKKNISQSMAERSWHSVACMKSSLSTDTLHLLWNNKLKERKILAKTDVHLSINHLDNSISYFKCKNCNNFCSGTHKITFYVGNRCEVEIIAFWSYPWRAGGISVS